jgi:hypothetical protein
MRGHRQHDRRAVGDNGVPTNGNEPGRAQMEDVMSDYDYDDDSIFDGCIYPNHTDGHCVCERKLGY